MESFTVKQGIEVQQRQLKEWEQLLKPEVFKLLKIEVERSNHLAKNGFGIARGSDIDNILHNVVLRSLSV